MGCQALDVHQLLLVHAGIDLVIARAARVLVFVEIKFKHNRKFLVKHRVDTVRSSRSVLAGFSLPVPPRFQLQRYK